MIFDINNLQHRAILNSIGNGGGTSASPATKDLKDHDGTVIDDHDGTGIQVGNY